MMVYKKKSRRREFIDTAAMVLAAFIIAAIFVGVIFWGTITNPELKYQGDIRTWDDTEEYIEDQLELENREIDLEVEIVNETGSDD